MTFESWVEAKLGGIVQFGGKVKYIIGWNFPAWKFSVNSDYNSFSFLKRMIVLVFIFLHSFLKCEKIIQNVFTHHFLIILSTVTSLREENL